MILKEARIPQRNWLKRFLIDYKKIRPQNGVFLLFFAGVNIWVSRTHATNDVFFLKNPENYFMGVAIDPTCINIGRLERT